MLAFGATLCPCFLYGNGRQGCELELDDPGCEPHGYTGKLQDDMIVCLCECGQTLSGEFHLVRLILLLV